MCDFKPGDEIVCVDASGNPQLGPCDLTEGAVYTVSLVGVDPWGAIGVVLVESKSNGHRGGYLACRFRKVQRKNPRLSIEALTVIKDGFEEPRRAPAPARKREEA